MLVVEDSTIYPGNLLCYCDTGYRGYTFHLIASTVQKRWGIFSVAFVGCKETMILHSAAHVYKASIC